MLLPEIGRRIATELRSADLVNAGLKRAYYPAPAQVVEGPAALVFAGTGEAPPWGEQIWHHVVRVQLMTPLMSAQALAAGLNALEPLVMAVWDHFPPNSNASRLIVDGEVGQVTHCYPVDYEASQLIVYAGAEYAAIVINFNVKDHRFAGDV
jgi:hypothetical protein